MDESKEPHLRVWGERLKRVQLGRQYLQYEQQPQMVNPMADGHFMGDAQTAVSSALLSQPSIGNKPSLPPGLGQGSKRSRMSVRPSPYPISRQEREEVTSIMPLALFRELYSIYIPGDVAEESPQGPGISVSAEVPPVLSVGTVSPRKGDQSEPPLEDPVSKRLWWMVLRGSQVARIVQQQWMILQRM